MIFGKKRIRELEEARKESLELEDICDNVMRTVNFVFNGLYNHENIETDLEDIIRSHYRLEKFVAKRIPLALEAMLTIDTLRSHLLQLLRNDIIERYENKEEEIE